jgi:hypothetical protein
MADGTEYRLWRVQGEFRNDFDLHHFPFDRQTLALPFFDARARRENLVTPSTLGDPTRVGVESARELSGFLVTVELHRRTIATLAKTLIPLLLMTLVMYASLYFPGSAGEGEGDGGYHWCAVRRRPADRDQQSARWQHRLHDRGGIRLLPVLYFLTMSQRREVRVVLCYDTSAIDLCPSFCF